LSANNHAIIALVLRMTQRPGERKFQKAPLNSGSFTVMLHC
jgi:hypothetical protein